MPFYLVAGWLTGWMVGGVAAAAATFVAHAIPYTQLQRAAHTTTHTLTTADAWERNAREPVVFLCDI